MNHTEKLALQKDYPPNIVMKLRLVTEEACTNAYEYCKSKGYKSLFIKWAVTSKTFEIFVRHKGELFEITKDDQINTSLRGRGITLITNIMDQVELREENNYVELYMMKEMGE
ncbi:ATP-binding protein [Bacillus sp. 31A1R]|uniref:ATP-binding protein n=2 Tax=Robertmurraya mangrovi TaxID=3098077 RepID=A0ABU5J3V0_9BACI|nr:ATP-binding protein [Bacillus sp. 31A1R]